MLAHQRRGRPRHHLYTGVVLLTGVVRGLELSLVQVCSSDPAVQWTKGRNNACAVLCEEVFERNPFWNTTPVANVPAP